MGFKPITKNTPPGEPPHILSEDDAAIYRGILGQDGVLNIGSKLKSTVLSNNKVRVGDGVINVDGHIGRNAYADYEDLAIENGAAGQKRNDLIIASFSTTGSGGLDTYVLKVKKGVAGSTGTDPEVTKQDIYAGGKLREYPLYRVKLDGLSIVGVEQLFEVIPTVPELETKYNELNSAMIDKIYPIGSIYMSVINVSPETLFGGKWEIWGEGRVPVGVKTNDSSFDTPEKTGGSKSIDLSHSHTVDKHNHTSGSMYAAIDATSTWIGASRVGGKSYSCDVYADIPVQGKSYTAKYGARILGNTGEATTGTNSQLPSSQSILNPYITCYMWKRTA